jgi:alkyl sulfatase BDS1-like metallo-beta-lactamase superfamily hydrolase
MREPIYKSRPVAPNFAALGGERINDFIVMSEGFSNCYLIETPEGNIQINSGMGMEAPIHRRNFESFSDQKNRFLILTQGHTDHIGGVAYFRERNPGMELIAQAGNTEHVSYDVRLGGFRGSRSGFAFIHKFVDAAQYIKENNIDDIPAQDVPTPDILFEENYKFTLGGLDVELIAIPGAETNDSLVVWLPQHKICFTGNLFGCPFGHFPNLVTIRGDRYRDALTCAAAVEKVRELGAEMICYGHHAPVIGAELIESELVALRDAIYYVHDETVKGMNEGKDVHTLMADIQLPPEMEVGQGYGKLPWSIRAIWENYAGWFHHESTTELYAVPQKTIHSDLLELAGGADALVDRAQQKLEHGKREQAIHLLDIVLSQQPEHANALAVMIAVHKELLEETGNFWLSSWLNNQIKVLTERLA